MKKQRLRIILSKFTNNSFRKEIVISNKPKSNRPERVAKEIRVILSEILSRSELKDPILFDKTIIISEVTITNDLSSAKVYIYPWDIKIDESILLKTLKKHVPFFRHQLAKKLRIKVIANLIFIIDKQLDKIQEVENLFKNIAIED